MTDGLPAAALLLAINAVVVRVVSRSERRTGLRRADVEAALGAQGGAGDVAQASLTSGVTNGSPRGTRAA